MQIDDVLNAVRDKYHQIQRDSRAPNRRPRIVIYMEHDFFVNCKQELQGRVSLGAYEFLHEDTLNGFPVWTVRSRSTKGQQVRHQPFVVVELDA